MYFLIGASAAPPYFAITNHTLLKLELVSGFMNYSNFVHIEALYPFHIIFLASFKLYATFHAVTSRDFVAYTFLQRWIQAVPNRIFQCTAQVNPSL